MTSDLHHTETAQIIQFSAARPKLGKRTASRSEPVSTSQCGDGISTTCRNQRLRSHRRDIWREADAVMDYWHVSMKMDGAISRVQHHETPEGALHPVREPKDYWVLVAKYREAWARLMLTPSPDMQSVTWKRAQLKAENHKHTGLKTERIERAIADDVEFLRTHPTRQSRKRDQEQ